jgi:hypothetical protein
LPAPSVLARKNLKVAAIDKAITGVTWSELTRILHVVEAFCRDGDHPVYHSYTEGGRPNVEKHVPKIPA